MNSTNRFPFGSNATVTDCYQSSGSNDSFRNSGWRSAPSPTSSFVRSGTPSTKTRRRRGVVLTQQGWQKLAEAGVLYDEFGRRYTHEDLGERSLLDVRTISRLLSCEVKVDKRTLKTFFRAFDLNLEPEDYTTPTHPPLKTSVPTVLSSIAVDHPHEMDELVEELAQLKQRILDDYSRLCDLLGLDQAS